MTDEKLDEAAEIWIAHQTCAVLKGEIKSYGSSDAFKAGAQFQKDRAIAWECPCGETLLNGKAVDLVLAERKRAFALVESTKSVCLKLEAAGLGGPWLDSLRQALATYRGEGVGKEVTSQAAAVTREKK